MSIASSSVLVEMNISVWTASKLDQAETEEVNNRNSAGKKAAQVRKNLMAGTSERKKIADYAAGCRLWHNTSTLPWSNKGPRLLPTSLFLPYKSEANVRRDTFNQMVDKFIVDYPALVRIAEYNAEGLGTMFNISDYPSQDEVRSMFGFKLVFSPVPESGDFRLDVPTKELEEMKHEYEEAFDGRLKDAMKEPWDRLHTVLKGISGKLEETDDPEKKKRYHDTLITNATDLCDLLSHLNVTKDPELEKARRQLERVMMGADIESLKESPEIRMGMKSKVDEMLKQYDW